MQAGEQALVEYCREVGPAMPWLTFLYHLKEKASDGYPDPFDPAHRATQRRNAIAIANWIVEE